MPRPTKHSPERGDARTRLLNAAIDLIRAKGFAATSVEDLCEAAQVTKGSYFHHFKTKEALGVAAVEHWQATSDGLLADAPYHAPDDPLDRLLAYVAFRKSIIAGDVWEFSCLAGTMVQEMHATSPAIRDACRNDMLGHAATLEGDIAAAMKARGLVCDWTAESLTRHTQSVIQGAFVIAKAGNDAELAREALDHLDRYIRLLFDCPNRKEALP